MNSKAMILARNFVSALALLLTATTVSAASTCPDLFTLRHNVDNPDVTAEDLFGYEVASNSWKVAVGSKQDDDPYHNSGSVYIFSIHTGNPLKLGNGAVKILNPYPNRYDHFGDRLEFVGTRLAVGAHYNDKFARNAGAVYVFSQFSGNLLQELYSPTPTEGDLFGFALSTLGDDRIVVGAHRADSAGGVVDAGAAYIFDVRSGDHLRTLANPDPDIDDRFGISMATIGNRVFVGAHYADINGIQNSGAVYIFDADTGASLGEISSPALTENGKFGYAISAVGDKVVVGAWADGTLNEGAAYVFDIDGNHLGTLKPAKNTSSGNFPANAEFGYSVSAMGNDVIVGAPNDGENGAGQAYLFDLDNLAPGSNGVVDPIYTFVNPHPDVRGNYGYSVSSAGSNNIAIGSPRDDTSAFNSGYAFFYGGCGRISGYSYEDDSNDGSKDSGESKISSVKVHISGTDVLGNPISYNRRTSRKSGYYSFVSLLPGQYFITEDQPDGYLDGIDTPGSNFSQLAFDDETNDFVNDKFMIYLEADANGNNNQVSFQNNFGELRPASISGHVYHDANENGEYDAGDSGISGVTLTLSDGNATVSGVTTSNGYYVFDHLSPGTYSVSQEQPESYLDGLETVGTAGGVADNDVISSIVLSPGTNGEGYNFGEFESITSVCVEPRTMPDAFWKGNAGRELIEGLDGDYNSTLLAEWLATSYPNLYGPRAGKDYGAVYKIHSDGTIEYKSNKKMHDTLRALFKKKTGASPMLEAEIMAAAISTYVTDVDLAGENAVEFGFLVDTLGAGATTYNVGENGEAFGVENDETLTINQLLMAANNSAIDGVVFAIPDGAPHGDDDSSDDSSDSSSDSSSDDYEVDARLRELANNVFDGVNDCGSGTANCDDDSSDDGSSDDSSSGGSSDDDSSGDNTCDDHNSNDDTSDDNSSDDDSSDDDVPNDDVPGDDVPPSTGDDLCEQYGGKPVGMVFTYTAQNCSASQHNQGDKFDCTDFYNAPATAHIQITAKTGYAFDGVVSTGDTVTMHAGSRGNIDSNTTITVRHPTQGHTKQIVEFHASCSVPISKGDQYGSMRLEDFIPD